ncbi:hypothetical protein HNR23_000785 [Nocardiopsis mwathae]|uniref:Uncharacterized protein n=1 Tax=Nocardiopsis mwathae TaxID=1472723 RepID=A0A7W9YEJ4_9ACTN|nr:hypothetical protein [Nocardiopsis mwathae]MBB6170725.1 hypothetical protein [Nocardiopsis mwathae]
MSGEIPAVLTVSPSGPVAVSWHWSASGAPVLVLDGGAVHLRLDPGCLAPEDARRFASLLEREGPVFAAVLRRWAVVWPDPDTPEPPPPPYAMDVGDD